MSGQRPAYNWLGIRLLASFLLIVAVLGCKYYKPAAFRTVTELLLGPEEGPAQQAFGAMRAAFSAGEDVTEAVSVFCREFSRALED